MSDDKKFDSVQGSSQPNTRSSVGYSNGSSLESEIVSLEIPNLDAHLRMRLHASGDQIISKHIRRDKVWEYFETLLTLKHLKSGDVFVDVGANIGYYSLLAYAKVGPTGKVLAYEPDPENFELLQHNLDLNACSQVLAFPYALYDKNTSGDLFLSDDNFGDHRIYPSPEQRVTRKIRLVNGAQHVSRHTQRIDFLKVDTQGAEYFVVKGLFDLIHANREHLKIVLEFTPFGLRHSGASGQELLDMLDGIGMEYYIIDHNKSSLLPMPSSILADWVKDTDDQVDNEGFMNLFITPKGYPVF